MEGTFRKTALITMENLDRKPMTLCYPVDYTQASVPADAACRITLVLGALIVVLAVWVEVRFSPPLWVHAVLWPVVTLPLAVLMIRAVKAALVAQQYRYRASEMGL